MKITVIVKPNCKKQKIDKISETEYLASVNVPPSEGKANARVMELLADYFGVSKSKVVLLKGRTSQKKIIEILS